MRMFKIIFSFWWSADWWGFREKSWRERKYWVTGMKAHKESHTTRKQRQEVVIFHPNKYVYVVQLGPATLKIIVEGKLDG